MNDWTGRLTKLEGMDPKAQAAEGQRLIGEIARWMSTSSGSPASAITGALSDGTPTGDERSWNATISGNLSIRNPDNHEPPTRPISRAELGDTLPDVLDRLHAWATREIARL